MMGWIDVVIGKLIARFGMDIAAILTALVFFCLLVGLAMLVEG